eukprot:TRINITY_DN13778_c0_g1_i1.p1 TRINITY_DN13778_c0_g1~~TRINITY_DN13778_c0_g1_i1.p1  ORF type:complete len:141 (-),score=8.10 TRINITY_DN13778_c0_g1_i1:20-442(-)
MLRISAATQLAVTGPVMGKCAFPRAMLTILGYYVARRAEWCKLSKLASTWRASPAELRHLQSLSNCDEFWLTSVCANARALHIREGGQSSATTTDNNRRYSPAVCSGLWNPKDHPQQPSGKPFIRLNNSMTTVLDAKESF